MRPVLFDTSIYIAALQAGNEAVVGLRRITSQGPLWLSAVVLEELYAGVSWQDRRIIDRLERDFERAQRILVPNLKDWTETGQGLARLAAEYGYEQVGKGRLTNDALIAASAGRQGITVITANQRDFSRLAEFRDFRFEVKPI